MKTKSRSQRELKAVEEKLNEAVERAVALVDAPYNTHEWKKRIMWESTALYYDNLFTKMTAQLVIAM